LSAAFDAGEIVFGALGARLAALAEGIVRARDVDALARLAPEIPALGAGLVLGDAGSALAMRVTSELNDRLGARVIALVAAGHRLPAASWCWLALGSEGRAEQTFVTDQDNGLVFSAEGAAEARALRQLFQPFAHAVNQALAACGFPLCAGGIMAGNPAWCLSLEEWRRRFSDWIRTPDPQALLNATIFFDFRPLHGDAGLAAGLHQRLLGLTAANEAFIRMMASNALTVAPPLNLLGDIVGDGEGIDLKKDGARLFVDAARIFALAAGLPAVGTAARLHAAAQAGRIQCAEAKAASQAFGYLQHIRLARQAEAVTAGRTPNNRVRRDELDEFEHRAVTAALKQARRLQQDMKLAFGIDA
jgi:CBS domain-containing protein